MKRMSLVKGIILSLFFVLLVNLTSAQTTIYKRLSVIQPRAADPEGYGNLIAGQNVTGNAAPQIFAVSGELNTNPIIPRIYEFKYNGTSWDSVWAAVPNIPDQNTWAALTVADLDGDGKKEVIWGPVNSLNATTNPNPDRILVYEAQGGGSDALGIPDGSGGYKPNSSFTISDSITSSGKGLEIRPFKWVAADINNDGKQELIFADRQSNFRFGVLSVDKIPDVGDTSTSHWTILASGLGQGMKISTIYDLAVIDSTIYLFDANGAMEPVYYANGKFTIGKLYANVVPGGVWKSAQVVDIAKDGKKEIVIGGWTNGKVYLLQPAGDSLSTTQIADFSAISTRLNGSAVGDFNGDGKIDFAFGSRSGYSTPDAAIFLLSYKGGDITSNLSYSESVVDSSLMPGVQWDILSAGKIDSDTTTDEIVYSGIPRGGLPVPIAVLSSMKIDSLSTIANARLDANNDYIPDNLNKKMKVLGIVNAPNLQGTANLSYSVQDGNAGILLFKSGVPTTNLNYGDRVLVTGTVAQDRGTTELTIANPATDIVLIDTGRSITPKKVTIESYLGNAENYESQLIELDGVAKASNSAAWPSSGGSTMTIWDTHADLSLIVNGNTDLNKNSEPKYPINVVGVGSQYTSSATVYNDGYQITPGYYKDIQQGVAVPPSPYFYFSTALHQALDTKPALISDSTEVDTLSWAPSIDLNNDKVIYQVVGLVEGTEVWKVPSGNSGADTNLLVNATDLLKLMAGKDTLMIDFTVLAKSVGTTEPITSSMDTLHVKLINTIITGINDRNVPLSFYVNQNYPNPFNPSTIINFGLMKQQAVDLRVYDILGQQVEVLLNHQPMNAGAHSVKFNASRLASGTYIYRLQAGENIITKKMILMK